MSQSDDVPGSVRIRCGEGSNEWRYDSIEKARKFYGINRSDAVSYAAHDVPELVRAVRDVLDRDDLTVEQKRDMAGRLNRAVRGVQFEVEAGVTIERD